MKATRFPRRTPPKGLFAGGVYMTRDNGSFETSEEQSEESKWARAYLGRRATGGGAFLAAPALTSKSLMAGLSAAQDA